MSLSEDEKWMQIALAEAHSGAAAGEVPQVVVSLWTMPKTANSQEVSKNFRWVVKTDLATAASPCADWMVVCKPSCGLDLPRTGRDKSSDK